MRPKLSTTLPRPEDVNEMRCRMEALLNESSTKSAFRPKLGAGAKEINSSFRALSLCPCAHNGWLRRRREGLRSLLFAAAHIWRIGVLHTDDMIAGIDMVDLPGDASSHVRGEIDGGVADFLDA